MTDVAASDFRHPRRYVPLDTILRLRWLAVLGQLATIFIVAQGLEFDVEVIPCLTIIGLSALLNLALQIAFNPMQRLEPAYAAALLALNIIELAGLLFFTGGLENPFSFLFLAPVLISATALPIRLTIALGVLAIVCSSVLVYFHLPLPWDGDDPLTLPPIYLVGVWLSIAVAIGVTSLYAFQVTEESRQLSDALAATELVLTREQHLTQIDGLAAAASTGRQPDGGRSQNPARTGAALPRYSGQDHPAIVERRTIRSYAVVHADRGSRRTASRFRRRDQGADCDRCDARARGHAQSRGPLWRRQHPGKRRRFRAHRGGGERFVDQRNGRDHHFRRRAGDRARHAEA
jgi:hypothetical protein